MHLLELQRNLVRVRVGGARRLDRCAQLARTLRAAACEPGTGTVSGLRLGKKRGWTGQTETRTGTSEGQEHRGKASRDTEKGLGSHPGTS